MGNAQSAESPRKTSQKLSKPKTGSHATTNLLRHASFSNSGSRLSNVPLPNPPSASTTAASTPTTSSAVEASAGLDRRINSDTSFQSVPGLQKESKRRSLFRSRSTRGPAERSRNPSLGPSTRMADTMPRASSMTYESAVAYYGQAGLDNRLPKSESRTSWNYNLMSYEAKRLLNLAEESGLEQTVVTETTWKSSNPANAPSAPITRSNSDISLYMPVRRRSVLQKPGVATRSSSTRDIPPLPKLSFRHSHPASPNLSRQQSFESYRSGVMSMPPRISEPDSVPRVVTPCDEQYRSIGTFKLGSLRITNGCPSPSPATPEVSRGRGIGGSSVGDAIAEDGYFLGGEPREVEVNPADATQLHAQSLRFGPLLSPSPLPPTSPALRTTSRVSALEDQLFEEETQPEYSSLEVLDVRLDLNAKSPHPQIERDTGNTVSRTDSGFESTTSPSSEASHKLLTKADSGYSSNVSLRSFHAKAQVPDREAPPPPVPPKDLPQRSFTSRPKPNAIVTHRISMPNLAREFRARTSKATRHVPIPLANPGDRGPVSPVTVPQTPGSVSSSRSDNSNSALSIGNGSHKPNRLRRFLSGARRSTAGPPAVYAIHPIEQSSIPPVPEAVEYKLHEHTRLLPATSKRLALRANSSLDTLKTIFSVGSIEASLDAVNSIQTAPTAPEPETREGHWKQTLHSVPASIANAATYVIARKSITRKPVPVRQEVVNGSGQVATRSQNLGGRTMSLTLPGEWGTDWNYRASGLDLAGPTPNISSSNLPSPVAKAMSGESKARAPPPVDTAMKRPLSLRVPPPLRPRSITNLSRKASRESLSRNSSMDSFHSYSPSSIADGSVQSISPSRATMDPRRLQSFRQFMDPQSSPYNSPNRELQMNHEMARRTSQAFPSGGSRRNSISSVQSEGVYGMQRSGSDQGWQVGARPQPLRHRASYDGFYQQQHSQYRHPPSMSNGYTAPSKPTYDLQGRGQLDAAATWSRSQFGAAAGQWYQDGFVKPNLPRGHRRNRSMGNKNGNGPNPPYRVLHSYNSPAYRNAPIWG